MSATPGTPIPAATTPPSSAVGGTSSGGSTTTSSGGYVPPATGNVPPATTTTSGDQGQAPQVAPTATSPQLAPVAKVTSASSTPSRGFWMGAAAFAVLILLMSLVLGDQPQPVAAGGSRLDRVLRGASADSSALANRS